MKKLNSIVAAVVIAPVLFASAPVFADSPGQLSNAPTNYKVRNVTKDGAYGQSTAAACNETVKYSIIAANSDFGQLSDLVVKANMKSGDINLSATNATGDTTSVSGSATVSTEGTLEYVAGSTVRIDVDNGQTQTPVKVGDGITTAAGVNVGDLAASHDIFVQFEAKVTCKTPPKEECKPGIPKGDKRCETVTVVHSTELTNTGPGSVAAIFAATAVAATAAYSWFLRRQNAR